jgi:hypothetical protein
MVMRILFGDGKIAVSVALQEEYPLLVLEEWAEGRAIGETIPNRHAGTKVPAAELEKALLVLEFKSIESIEIVMAQLQALRDCIRQRKGRTLMDVFGDEEEGSVPGAVKNY